MKKKEFKYTKDIQKRKFKYVRAKKIPSLEDVLKDFLEDNKEFKVPLKNYEVVNAWDEIIGEPFNKFSKALKLTNYVLYVKAKNSVYKAEIHFLEKDIIKRINYYFKGVRVKKIVVL